MRTTKLSIASFFAGACVLAAAPAVLSQTGTGVSAGDWPTHHGNELAQRLFSA